MSAKHKIVHGRGLSNLNLGIFVCSSNVWRASKPVPSINYGYPQFSFWTLTTLVKIYLSYTIINRGKNIFELVGTVLKLTSHHGFLPHSLSRSILHGLAVDFEPAACRSTPEFYHQLQNWPPVKRSRISGLCVNATIYSPAWRIHCTSTILTFFKVALNPLQRHWHWHQFGALIFVQRPFTLSVNFIFHGPPLLAFKTDRLDLRGLDQGKSDVKGSLA